jgi:DNA-binding transcriptional MerR regulator
MSGGERTTRITVTIAARRTGLEPHVVRHCVQIGLLDETLTEDELVELRRVRRLPEPGVNLAGVEIILRMRRRIVALQEERARLEALVKMSSAQDMSENRLQPLRSDAGIRGRFKNQHVAQG